MQRRQFLGRSLAVLGSAAVAPNLLGCSVPGNFGAPGPYGPLLAADANRIHLPAGFTSRVIATSGQTVPGTGYQWHGFPDGGATFTRGGGGWTYVSNSEIPFGLGGASAIDFDATGKIVGARRILGSTDTNCAGGPTPWGTWLSCEETDTGQVHECDPSGARAAVARPAMGRFKHEAAAVDPVGRAIYLTEDTGDGRLYRFRPTVWEDLSRGTLEVATVSGATITWTVVPDPSAASTPTRQQVPGSTAFSGGEGAWYADGKVWFTTKGDNRIREIDVRANPQTIKVIYDGDASADAVLKGVDNLTSTTAGDLYVCEDGDTMDVCLIAPGGATSVFLRVVGQDGSELTGVAFDPSGSRMYLSSQRGPGAFGSGVTYEIAGPFRR